MSVRKRTWTTLGGVVLALTVTVADAADAGYSANFVMPGCRVMLNYNDPTFDPTFQAGLCAGLVAGARYSVYRRPDLCADVPKDASALHRVCHGRDDRRLALQEMKGRD